MACFLQKKRGCIKQKKITSAPQENNGPSSSEIIHSLTTSQKAGVKKASKQIFEEANNKIQTIFPGLHIAEAAKVAPEFKFEKSEKQSRKTEVKAEDIQRVYREY